MNRYQPTVSHPRVVVAFLVFVLVFLPIGLQGASANTEGETPTSLYEMVDRVGVKGDGRHYTGFKPSPPGDYETISLPGYRLEELSASVDLSGQLPPVGNQGAQGSCVGWATSYYYKSWSEKQEHVTWDLTNPWYQYSPAFVYNQINGGVDGGAYFEDAFDLMQDKGDIDIADMPYSQSDYTSQPSTAQLNAAMPYDIQGDWSAFWNHSYLGPYNPPNPIEQAQAWLDSGKILVMGVPIYYDFPSFGGNPSNPYYDYNGSSNLAGGHAVTICGYDDNINPDGADPDHQGGFLMANSWGAGWNGASQGFVYLSYDFAKRYVWEAWTMNNNVPDSPGIDFLSSESGNVGGAVAVNGDNFGTERRAAGVTFNGTAASDVSFTNGEISVVVPAGATSGPVVVSDWEGTPSNGIEFTVGVPVGDPPTVSSMSPDTGGNNGQLSVSVFGSNFQAGCQVWLVKNGEPDINATSENRIDNSRVDCTLELGGALPGAWDVVVINPDSSSGSLPGGFTVTGPNDTFEPNNSFIEAYGPLEEDTDYHSFISTGTDLDYYKLNVPEGCQSLTAELKSIPEGTDYDLYLYDASQEELAYSWEWGSADELIAFNYPAAGIYYLLVETYQGFSDADSYLLRFACGDDPLNDTFEPNNSFIEAYGPLNQDTDYYSFISTNNDLDYYKLNVPEGCQSLTAELKSIPEGNDYDLCLYDASQEEIAYSWEWGDADELIEVEAPAAGTYYLFVEPYEGFSDADPYLLRFSLDITTPPTPPSVSSISPSAGEAGDLVVITGSGFGSSHNSSCVSFGSVMAASYTSWADTRIECEVPQDISGIVKVTVTTPDGTSNSGTFTVKKAPSPPPEPGTTPTWYLAEGTTDWGFDCYITIQNPNEQDVSASVTYMTDTGPMPGGDIDLPPLSQVTINPYYLLGKKDFSTKVECKEGKTIAVDRTMSWTGEGAPSPDGHCSIGVTSPAKTWYFPEGSSSWGFETWLLIQNPNEDEATAEVTYMIEGEELQVFTKTIPANSRKTYNIANDIGAADASIKVDSDVPVIPERAMYRNNGRSGHDSIGSTAPATSYYLAEGTTNHGFTTYVLVQNPNPSATEVTLTYMTTNGPVPQPPFTMDSDSRKTIKVNDVLPATDFSIQVIGTQPIIAERAMYWSEGTTTGEASHDSIGLAASHTTFYLPDGQTSNGHETYTLVQNPNDTDITVEVTYLTPDEAGNANFTETVTANSRKTFSMADKGIVGRAAVMVTSKTAGKKIVVERAIYWNNRGAGTDTIGGYSD